jgi:hypothetical protein
MTQDQKSLYTRTKNTLCSLCSQGTTSTVHMSGSMQCLLTDKNRQYNRTNMSLVNHYHTMIVWLHACMQFQGTYNLNTPSTPDFWSLYKKLSRIQTTCTFYMNRN